MDKTFWGLFLPDSWLKWITWLLFYTDKKFLIFIFFAILCLNVLLLKSLHRVFKFHDSVGRQRETLSVFSCLHYIMSVLLPILKLTHLAFLHSSSDFFDIPWLWPLLNQLLLWRTLFYLPPTSWFKTKDREGTNSSPQWQKLSVTTSALLIYSTHITAHLSPEPRFWNILPQESSVCFLKSISSSPLSISLPCFFLSLLLISTSEYLKWYNNCYCEILWFICIIHFMLFNIWKYCMYTYMNISLS